MVFGKMNNLNVLYEEFEPNGLIYNTNDKDKKIFKNRYWIQWWNKENFDWQFFENEEDLFKFVREFFEEDRIFNSVADILNYEKELKTIDNGKHIVLTECDYVAFDE